MRLVPFRKGLLEHDALDGLVWVVCFGEAAPEIEIVRDKIGKFRSGVEAVVQEKKHTWITLGLHLHRK